MRSGVAAELRRFPAAAMTPSTTWPFTPRVRTGAQPARWFSRLTARAPVPAWIPADVDSFISIRWDFPALLQGLGSWFDEQYGEGEEGIFESVLQDVHNEPGGPGVDVPNDVVAQLVGPVTVITASADVLFAARTKDEPTVAVAVERMLRGDPDVEQIQIGDHVVWFFRDQNVAHKVGSDPVVDPQEMFGPDLSNYVICVAEGRLFIATDRALLERLLQHDPSAKGLAGQLDFQAVLTGLGAFATERATGWQFARIADTVRPAYEALRAGKREELRILGGQMLAWHIDALSADSTLSPARSSDLVSRFELLPPFDTIRQHLTCLGTVTTELPDGWRISGMILARPASEATDETR